MQVSWVSKNTKRLIQGHYERSSIVSLPNRFYQFSKTICQIPDILLAHGHDFDLAAHNSLSPVIRLHTLIPYIREVQIVHNRSPETKNYRLFSLRKRGGG